MATRYQRSIEVRISLLGHFSTLLHGDVVLDQAPSKVQELLAYLVLHRGRAHPREVLADVLWGDCGSPHARKYLRQALWQLHAGLVSAGRKRASRLIRQEPGWVELVLDEDVWVDIVAFEDVFNSVRGKSPLAPNDVKRIVEAIQLYGGELLEGSSRRWCLYERDRFREMYLTLLDKIINYCEGGGQYEAGIAFATLALRCDRARERTHQSLMSLMYLAGDRTGAIRQYERCVLALKEELGIEPCAEITELYRHIRGDESKMKKGSESSTPTVPLVVMTPNPISNGRPVDAYTSTRPRTLSHKG